MKPQNLFLLVVLVVGLAFLTLSSSSAAPEVTANWVTTGNKIKGSDFIGTNNNKALVLKANKIEVMRLVPGGNVGIGTTTPGFKLTVAGVVQSTSGGFKFPDGSTQTTASVSGPNGWSLSGNQGTNPNSNFLGTTDIQALGLRTFGLERMRITSDGKVGIGTNSPGEKLTVQTATANYGFVHTDGTITVGSWVGTGGATPAGGWFGTKSNHPLHLFVANASPSLTISTDGSVAVGGVSNGRYFSVYARDTSSGTTAFNILNPSLNSIFRVWDDGQVAIGGLGSSTTSHVCHQSGPVILSSCSSAAEYVPTIDGGSGFPETADLVSFAPALTNPYGDAHAPFTVRKSATPCDATLLGFIVKPESGADGVKLNDHYLPLAIYGYFPAKVTMENGTIQRGDPLTSSSKPGYAMKATEACKIIGYALEDTSLERTIQVFADAGESTLGQIAKMQKQMDTLAQDNLTLKQENAALQAQLTSIEARLVALERMSPVSQNTNVDAGQVTGP